MQAIESRSTFSSVTPPPPRYPQVARTRPLAHSPARLLTRPPARHPVVLQPDFYTKVGSDALVAELCTELDAESGGNHGIAYPIPVGGSNWLGTWGYLCGNLDIIAVLTISHDFSAPHH